LKPCSASSGQIQDFLSHYQETWGKLW
jgi:hypothetical protein